MAKGIKWTFEILDRLTGPARRMEKAIDRIERKLDALTPETSRAEKATEKLGRAARKSGDGIGWLGLKITGWLYALKAVGSAVGGVLGGLGRLGFAFAKAGVEAAGFRESTSIGLGVLLKDPGKAEKLMKQAVRWAGKTPFTTEDSFRWVQDLTAAGFRDAQLWEAMGAAGDVAALRGFSPQVFDQVVTVLRQVKGKGRLQGEEVMQLAEAGIPSGAIWEALAKKTGISAVDLQTPKYAGKISGDLGVWAIKAAIAEKFSGGKLGNLMLQQSGTAGGLMSTLGSRPFEMMMDLDKSKGFQSFKVALKNLTDVLDPETPAGKRIKQNVENLFNKMMGGLLDRFADPKAVENWINSLITGFERLMPTIERSIAGLGKVAEATLRLLEYAGGSETPELQRAFNTLGAGQTPSLDAAQKAREVIERAGKKLGPVESETYLRAYKGAKGRPSTSLNLAPGAIRIEVNGAQDPKAVADEAVAALAIYFEGLAAQAGA